MIREPTIPLFLWIATALLVHVATYEGSEEVVKVVEERRALREFAAAVYREVDQGPEALDVVVVGDALDEEPEEPPAEPPEEPPPPDQPPPEEEPERPERPLPMPEPPEELQAKVEPPAPPKPAEPAAESPPSEPPPKLELPPMDKRISVVQHAKRDQADNPNARFIADEANHTAEETAARITSTDQDDPNPTPGAQHAGEESEPGNADDTRIAQSEDVPGEPNQASEPAPVEAATAAAAAPPPPPPAPAAAPPAQTPPLPAQDERLARAAVRATDSLGDPLVSREGETAVPSGRAARAAAPAQSARRKRLPPPPPRPGDLLRFGSNSTTANGVNLNLSPAAVVSAVGADQLAMERRQDGERRRSEHRGSWTQVGFERWRAAIENYVASVKPGNQTALNTARVPFASYLNQIHNKIHPIFADSFLRSLDALPAGDELNRADLVTHLEIVVSRDDGRLVRLGVTRPSGHTRFDIGALESVNRAAPFGKPPPEIVSPDGNVYLHWEFHRNPMYACSTYNARPYILKAQPSSAPPRVAPPRRDARPPSDERHGSLPHRRPVL